MKCIYDKRTLSPSLTRFFVSQEKPREQNYLCYKFLQKKSLKERTYLCDNIEIMKPQTELLYYQITYLLRYMNLDFRFQKTRVPGSGFLVFKIVQI